MIKDFKHLHSYHITPAISEKAIDLMILFSLSHRLALPDALIAATALEHNIPLYTLNVKDFSYIKGINLYQP